jgi:Domain of unknown function (DUF4384)
MRASCFVVVLFTGGVLFGQQQTLPPDISARDVFWSAADLVSVSPNPGTTAAKPAKPPDSSPKKQQTSTPRPASSPKRQIDPKKVVANGYGAQPHLVSLTDVRLGLRYTLLQKDPSGRYVEVLPSTVFHTGDHVKLSLMANHSGYLYIIQQGSSGNWSPIFPSQDAVKDSNYIEPGQVYEIPNDGAFELNKQPGKERLFILLSVKPIDDLDGAIFGLQENKPEPTAAPASSPETVQAANRITDQLVEQLATRDLVAVQEQVDSSANNSNQHSEKAVYVVNSLSANSNGSRVVAELVLDHE